MASVALDRIHLVTCVGVDTEYAHLPHFIEHYRSLGIPAENFHIILNTLDARSDNLQRARALLRERKIAAPEIWIAPYTSDSMWAKRRAIQARAVPPDDWVISADVDEFHEYPEALPTFLAACDSRGVNCVQGVFIDRLAPGGQLAPVRADTLIWETFPIEADVQCAIGQTGAHHNWHGTIKTMALKGSLSLTRGGHHPRADDIPIHYLFGRHLAEFPNIGQGAFRFRVPLRVHHFKWTDSMPATLRRRLATPGVSPAGAEYGRKVLEYCDANHGIRLADVPIRTARSSRPEPWRRRVAWLRAIGAAGQCFDALRRLPRRIARRFA